MTKQSAHERFGGPAAAPDRHRQELLTAPARDRIPVAAGQQQAEVDAPARPRPAGRRATVRQDPLTGSAQRPGQDSPAPARQRRGRRGAASSPAYDLVKAADHAATARWVVTVDGVPVGSVRREVTTRGTRRWTAWLGDTKLADHRVPRTRQDAAVQVLMAYKGVGKLRRKPAPVILS